MDEKVIHFDLEAAKKKISDSKEQLISKSTEKARQASEYIKENTRSRLSSLIGGITELGINVSQRQLETLKRIKDKYQEK